MARGFTRLLILFCLGLLAGCSLFRTEPVAVPALPLLAPFFGPDATLLKQRVVINARGEAVSFMLVSRFESQRTRLAALLATGQPIMLLEYDGEQLEQQVKIPVQLPVEDILAMIQFAEWPEAALRQHYGRGAGWSLSLEAKRRQLWHHGALILDLTFSGEHIQVTHYPDSYDVSITTIERKDLQQ
ncbi:Protein of unknown function [Marinobacterium stanieri]|uniref:DUF3261 domain-containing protein n=1 Tax=Marinobacterium stanieri TaxID=49186 RepID=A0A1N6RRU3_9GAMM|nr:Protein of unknown function [Marinobacterium stanieri]